MIQNYKYYTGMLNSSEIGSNMYNYNHAIGVIDTFKRNLIPINKDRQIIISLILNLSDVNNKIDSQGGRIQRTNIFYNKYIQNCKSNNILNFYKQYREPYVKQELKRIYKAAYSIALTSQKSLQSITTNQNKAIPYMSMSKHIIQNISSLFGSQNVKFSAIMKINTEISLNGIHGITWGNIFQINQLPPYIKDNVYFQVNSVRNIISPSQ